MDGCCWRRRTGSWRWRPAPSARTASPIRWVKEWLRTGAQYQLVHAVAGLALLAAPAQLRGRAAAGWLFSAGALVFGGSLYALALTGVRVWAR